MFRSPAGSEVSEGVGGTEITEQRESRFRSHSGQGLREGTRRTAPAGPFGTEGKGQDATHPAWARGVGGAGDAWRGRALGPGEKRGSGAQPGPGAPPVGQRRGRDAQTGGAGPPAVCMLKYSVKPVCGGAAVWGTSGW